MASRIVNATTTGLRGDGLLYVNNIEGWVRISYGERGLQGFRSKWAGEAVKQLPPSTDRS